MLSIIAFVGFLVTSHTIWAIYPEISMILIAVGVCVVVVPHGTCWYTYILAVSITLGLTTATHSEIKQWIMLTVIWENVAI